jgi:hypothetical protein
VLIAGGVLNLAHGVLLGYPITVIRAKGAPATPKYLMATHVGTLLQAAILLGLVWAARLSALGPGWQDVAAWLVVVSSALIAAEDTLNWLTGVQDEFSERARPYRRPRSPHWQSQLVSASSSSASSKRSDARCHQPGHPRAHRHDRASPAAPITRICAWDGSCCHAPAGAQNGGYLEPSLSMPRLTRRSAALTCSWTAFT